MRPLEPWYRAAVTLLKPPFKLWFNWRFDGLERVPAEGPLIVAGNHLSYLDPIAHAYFVVEAGRRPRFLAKKELFDNRLLAMLLRGTRQIPVERGTGDQAPLEEATRSLEAGEVVVIYPEGTSVTTNEDFSPGRGKTGAVRLAMRTGVPILPVATWGGQHVWRKEGLQSLSFGRPIWLRAGEPVRIDDEDDANVRELTDALMRDLARLVAEMRDRYPPRWTLDLREDPSRPQALPRRAKRRG